MYFRIDMDDAKGEHLAIFADSNPDGSIFQQFCIALDGKIEDIEHCHLSTPFSGGRPIDKIDPKLGWRRIGGEEWEKGMELKREICMRDYQIALTQRPPCGYCFGMGRVASTRGICLMCSGTGKLP